MLFMLFDLQQYSDIAILFLRLAIAAIFIVHGLPKIKGAKTMAPMMGLSAPVVLLLGGVELVSGLALILGVYMQTAALLLSVVMLGAIYYKAGKWHMPFTAHDKTGWEFDLILLAATILIFVIGGGAIALIP